MAFSMRKEQAFFVKRIGILDFAWYDRTESLKKSDAAAEAAGKEPSADRKSAGKMRTAVSCEMREG